MLGGPTLMCSAIASDAPSNSPNSPSISCRTRRPSTPYNHIYSPKDRPLENPHLSVNGLPVCTFSLSCELKSRSAQTKPSPRCQPSAPKITSDPSFNMNTADFRYHQYPQGFQFPRRSWTPGYQRTAGHAEDSKRRIGRIIDHPVAVTAYDLFRPLIGITARAAIVVVCIAVSVTVVVIRYTITAIVYLYRRLHPYLKVAVRAAVTSANVAIGVAKRVVTAYNSGRQVWRDRSNPWRLFKSFFPAVDFAIEHRPHIPRPPSPQSDQCSTSSPSPSGSEEANIDGFELNSTPLHGASGEANAVAFPLSPSTAFHADTEVNLDAPIPQSVYQSKESEEPAGANTPLTTTERANLDPQEGCTLPQSEQNLITSVEPTNASSEHPLTPVTATNESTFSDKLSSRSDAACDAIDTEDLGQDLNGQNMDESVESCYLTEEQVEDVRDDETEHFYSHPIQKRSRWRGSSRWSLDSGYAEDTLPFPGH